MKRVFVLTILLLAVVALLAGCSSKGSTGDSTGSSVSTVEQAQQGEGAAYYEKSEPLENVDVDDLRKLEITPSGDQNCFLSPCNCNCYLIKNVPLTAKKPMCAVDCKDLYGIKGCTFSGYSCSAVK